jgi:hypothetical protein
VGYTFPHPPSPPEKKKNHRTLLLHQTKAKKRTKIIISLCNTPFLKQKEMPNGGSGRDGRIFVRLKFGYKLREFFFEKSF